MFLLWAAQQVTVTLTVMGRRTVRNESEDLPVAVKINGFREIEPDKNTCFPVTMRFDSQCSLFINFKFLSL
jgi:hypothetical protein